MSSGRNSRHICISLFLLLVLSAAALVEFLTFGLARRTFVFYAIERDGVIVEERMLRAPQRNAGQSRAWEFEITQYVEEALLGPISSNYLPLFPAETRLQSLLYRDGVAYIGLSEDAVLPPPEGGEVFTNMKTLYFGIKRNFPSVRDVRFFIAGKAAYANEFRQLSGLTGLEALW